MADLAELIRLARDLLDDHVLPPQFSDEVITGHYNDAVAEACIRTRVIQDSSSKVTSLVLVPEQATYKLDPSIFAVRRIRVGGQREPLERKDTSQMDEIEPGWDDPTLSSSATPRYAVFDYSTGEMRLHPRPNVAGTLSLVVWRAQLEDERFLAEDTSAEPPLPLNMHRELKHWVAGHCLLNPDSETRNPTLAGEHLALFEAAYGRKPTLHEIRLWSTNHRRTVTAHFD